ncbi:MAG TPA: radical SAM/SPASM domain-containing protein [bacterium]|nr:radical SAM/SPASM domain-containing protein [bacterium]HPS31428.1 radical SAM/SPASM domain-containing protein [bacterium]
MKIEYPRIVAIETTNRCNASCSFCPNSVLARERTTMSDELFNKIIDDCSIFKPESIEPFLNGEPLMDVRIFDRMQYIRKRLPDTKIKLYTNANLLTPEKIERLGDVGLESLFVSLNTINNLRYKKIMGLELEDTLVNLNYLVEAQNKKKIADRIIFRMTRTEDTELFEQDKFIKYCKEKGVDHYIVGLFNYKGQIHSPLPIPNYPCEHIDRIDILASGKVALCCMDQEGEYSWGDVNKDSILDVFNSIPAKYYRTMHRIGKRKKIAPCNRCNLFWPTLKHTNFLQRVKMAAEIAEYFLNYKPSGRKKPEREPFYIN